MKPAKPIYGSAFYERIRKGSQDSAAVIVPMVLANMGKVETVLDVGAGEGVFAAEFERHGCHVCAIDSGDVQTPAVSNWFRCDLMEPFAEKFWVSDPVYADKRHQFDLVVCLEVAEHLPESRAESFIADLCQAGKAVLFSAAIPGQGGDGHVHCAYPAVWAALFAKQEYVLSMAPRFDIWDDQRVKPWYRNNLGLALPESSVENLEWGEYHRDAMWLWFHTPAAEPHAVIHPDMWLTWKDAYTGDR